MMLILIRRTPRRLEAMSQSTEMGHKSWLDSRNSEGSPSPLNWSTNLCGCSVKRRTRPTSTVSKTPSCTSSASAVPAGAATEINCATEYSLQVMRSC
jgi:hypothetical protein